MTIKICLVCGKFKEKVSSGVCPACYMITYRREGNDKDLIYEGKCDNCGKIKPDVHRGLCQSCYKNKHARVKQLLAPLKKCECSEECQEMIPSITMEGKPARFKEGHSQKGKNNNMYKRGWFMKDNYKILTGYYDHPNASKKGELPEHVLVMTEYLNRPLEKGEVVHHIDPVREGYCNNDISNLQLVDRSKHLTIHNNEREYTRKDMTGTICIECGSDKTYPDTRTGEPHWMLHPVTGKPYVCEKCYKRIKAQTQTKVLYHRKKDISKRVCLLCGARRSESSSGQSTWRSDGKGGYVCKSCFDTKLRKKKSN